MSSSYPVGYESDFQLERSRLTTFFRGLLVIPVSLLVYVYGLGVLFSWLFAWVALMFTGRYPEGLYRFNGNVIRYFTRLHAYGNLLTDEYPPFDLDEHTEYPVRVPIAPPLEHYSRLKVFFRGLLALPLWFVAYAFQMLSGFVAFCSWFCIVFTGKQNESLQDAQNIAVAYMARFWAYQLYLTETWPPMSLDQSSGTAAVPAAPAQPSIP